MSPCARRSLSWRLITAERRRWSYLVFGAELSEELFQIPVAQSVDGELTSVHGLDQGVILRVERMQGAYGLPAPTNSTFDLSGQLFQGGAVVYGGQG